MTVLPNRPSDGKSRVALGRDEGAPNDHLLASLSAPPTLFKLPNLGVHKRDIAAASRESADRLNADPVHGVAPQGSRASDTRAPEASIVAKACTTPGNDVRAAEPHTAEADPFAEEYLGPHGGAPFRTAQAGTAPQAAWHGASSTASDASLKESPSAPRGIVQETPAGRSWMESLGSHGIVIALLLIVVAVALMTGQGDEDPAVGSLATQSELLNFDTLTTDLPLQFPDGDVKVAETVDVPPAEPVAAFSDRPLIGELSQAEQNSLPSEPSPQVEPDQAFPEPQPTSQSVVSLSEPQASTSNQLTITNPGSSSSDASGFQYNTFVAPSPGIVALPAGNRSDANQSISNPFAESQSTDSEKFANQSGANMPSSDASLLPSLEELAGLNRKPNPAAGPSSSAPVRVLTRTPVGISDWAKYLPSISSEPGTEPASTTSPLTLP